MGRKQKFKKVRHLDDVFKGDSHHDDAPSITDFRLEFKKEALKFERRKVSLERFRLESKRKSAERKVDPLGLRSKIEPGESLRDFSRRVDVEARVALAERAKIEINRNRKVRKEERVGEREERKDEESKFREGMENMKRGGREEEEYEDSEDSQGEERRKREKLEILPRFLEVADRPPELEVLKNSTERFKQMAGGTVSMETLQKRVDGLYQNKKRMKV